MGAAGARLLIEKESRMAKGTRDITNLILNVARDVRKEIGTDVASEFTQRRRWPISCTVGPGLEGAIACLSKVGYVDGSHGLLVYRGYDIFDLCARSTFEEVTYLLLKGRLPSARQLNSFKKKLAAYRKAPSTLRLLMGFPVENMNTMAALRLGANLKRQEFTYIDRESARPDVSSAISTDEDSIPMETPPRGEPHAIYEFDRKQYHARNIRRDRLAGPSGFDSCCHLIAGIPTIAAAISRLRRGEMPIEPDPDLSHAANYMYMLTGKRPSPLDERIMDVALILHADHGMNASTFATLVVASTLSDIYISVGSGIAALSGPLHGGANEEVLRQLRRIGDASNADEWCKKTLARKHKVFGFGHRVYKTYDPRARVLKPLVAYLAKTHPEAKPLLKTAEALEEAVVSTLGAEKGIYPNVDFYSGLIYTCMGLPTDMFTSTFAVARVSGWTARVLEYLEMNRIFRPRALYVGPLNKEYVPIEQR